MEVRDEEIHWRAVRYWEYSLISTLAWGGLLFAMIILTMIALAILLENGMLIYLGIASAFFGFFLWIAANVVIAKNAPKRVGYSSDAIYADYMDRSERIPFEHVKGTYAHKNENLGIVVEDVTGNQHYFAPGLGGLFGMSFIEAFRDWAVAERRKTAQIKERTVGLLPRLRVIEAKVE